METERRKINVQEISLRRELELFVVGCNSALKKVVETMDNIILLRNAHPVYRDMFALKFRDAGLISREDSKEFIKVL